MILEIITMLNDPELSDEDKAEGMIEMFYEQPENITDLKAAIAACYDFMDAGRKPGKKSPKLVDWEQDFEYIIAPVNRVLNREAREDTPLHWWTFLSAYMEIGNDCMFSQIVTIRDKLARGKKLEKYERDWYNRNKETVTIRTHYSDEEEDLIKHWTQGGDMNG